MTVAHARRGVVATGTVCAAVAQGTLGEVDGMGGIKVLGSPKIWQRCNVLATQTALTAVRTLSMAFLTLGAVAQRTVEDVVGAAVAGGTCIRSICGKTQFFHLPPYGTGEIRVVQGSPYAFRGNHTQASFVPSVIQKQGRI